MTLHLSIPATIISALALVSISAYYYYQADDHKTHEHTHKVDTPAKDILYLAQGNEPFWNASIRADQVVFTTPEQDIQIDVNQDSNKEGIVFLGHQADEAFSLVITNTNCHDSMQDKAYSLTVKVELNGIQYLGCAWRP